MIFNVLRELDKPGVKSLKDIEKRLGMSDNMLEYILDDMERRGYISRQDICGSGCNGCDLACPLAGDNKVFMSTWEITERGKKLLRKSRT